MPNRLASETSPYLLQHANNPVDWYPWGDEALAAAREADRPIFLSIGYSACHWCHVMEHESFENAQVAALMNEGFINIKVDREERPDLDQVYMQAVQLLTGRGGWPMSVFLTPDLRPFYGGTYFPPSRRGGMPGFDQVLTGVREAWTERRAAVVEQAAELTQHLTQAARGALREDGGDTKPPVALSGELLVKAGAALERVFDFQYGGFGGAPKFPHPMDLRLLLRVWRHTGREGLLHIVTHTLDRMAGGGIYDQLGGGFHRYSVDARWLAPHFEKMLYDNALLLIAYLEAHQATGHGDYARIVRETADYVLRDMTGPDGGFYSTEDADSEEVEGKYYVWTPAELTAILGTEAAHTFAAVYDVSESGNFEDANILNLPKTIAQCAALQGRDLAELEAELAASRAKLLAARDARIAPALDDKVLVAWNGLMIDALARAGAALDEPGYVEAAARAASFIDLHLRDASGRLLHTWRAGHAKHAAFLDDYACLANGLVTLYEAQFDERWLTTACELMDVVLARFADPAEGTFFYTADDHAAPLARQKEWFDNAVPSSNAMVATVLLRLGRLASRSDYLAAAEGVLQASASLLERAPTGAGQMLLALDMYLGPTYEAVLVGIGDGDDARAVVRELWRKFWPNRVLACRPAGPTSPTLDPLFAGRTALGGPTLYLCENFACQAPLVGRDAILADINVRLASPAT